LLLAAPDTDVPPRPVEWNKLVERAGLSLDALKPIPPSAPPPVPFDARAAWSGAFPNSDIPIRVEAAAWHGMPVFFSISGDWQPRNNAEPVERPRRVAATISTVMTAMAIVLAWRNFRRRRGDRNGALRVSIGTFIIALTGALLGTSWPAVAMERLGWTFELVSESLGVAALAYVLYLAVEPYLRQRWPDRLISWSRLLAARFRDPMVGRDILIGLVGSTAYALISVLTPVIASLLSTPQAAPLLRGTSALLGVTNTIALALSMILSAAGVAFLNMTVLVVATIVLRKRIAAGAVLLLLHFAIYRSAVTIPLLVAISLAFLMTYIAYRFGLLTVFVMYAFYLMIYLFPVVPVPWATALAAIVYVAFAAVAVWAFHTSLGGQSPFADTLDS
jgi:uncharacterized membrane protein YfcA